MDYDIVVFWFICLSSLVGLLGAFARLRTAARGWIVVYLCILLILCLGRLWHESVLIYIAAGLWFLLVVLPSVLASVYYRYVLQQKYGIARRLAWIIGFLHPADSWRQHSEIIRALEMAHSGRTDEAIKNLQELQKLESFLGIAATLNLFRLTSRWEDLLRWEA